MTSQILIICENKDEEQQLTSRLKNYTNYINDEKYQFPIVIDKSKKIIFRCTSVSCCANYVASNKKILKFKDINKENDYNL